jgi:hypothetical protein
MRVIGRMILNKAWVHFTLKTAIVTLEITKMISKMVKGYFIIVKGDVMRVNGKTLSIMAMVKFIAVMVMSWKVVTSITNNMAKQQYGSMMAKDLKVVM